MKYFNIKIISYLFSSIFKRSLFLFVPSLIITLLFFGHFYNITKQEFKIDDEKINKLQQISSSVSFENLSHELSFLQIPVFPLKFNIYAQNKLIIKNSKDQIIKPDLNITVYVFNPTNSFYSPNIKFDEKRKIFNREISLIEIPYIKIEKSFSYFENDSVELEKDNKSIFIYLYPTVKTIMIIFILMIFTTFAFIRIMWSLLKFIIKGSPITEEIKDLL